MGAGTIFVPLGDVTSIRWDAPAPDDCIVIIADAVLRIQAGGRPPVNAAIPDTPAIATTARPSAPVPAHAINR